MPDLKIRPDSQRARILKVLMDLRGGKLTDIPGEYIKRCEKLPNGVCRDGISSRYFKHVMKISECNGRISELRADLIPKGWDIQSSDSEDAHGFKYQRLVKIDPPKAQVATPENFGRKQLSIGLNE